MARLLALMLVAVSILPGCGPFGQDNVSISWVDFVKFNDIYYQADGHNYDNQLTSDDLGPVFDQVKFKVADNINRVGYEAKNGDAAFHEEGTVVYTLKGYSPEFRLAILEDERVIIYEAYRNPKATRGEDLLDLEQKVAFISVNSERDATIQLATITEPELVESMVSMVLEAQVKEDSGVSQGKRYFIAFHMLDGTVVNRSFWIETGLMSPGLLLPGEFVVQVLNALDE